MRNKNYIIDFFKHTGKIPKLSGFRFEDPLQIAFKLPPERALEWLKRRGKNLKISIDWDELDAEAHNKAFTVAKVMSADILQLIYDYVEKAKSEGMTLSKFQTMLLPRLEEAGWTGVTPSRLKVIYDTNMQMAYSQGKYHQQKLISHIYPYWKYTQIQRPTKRHNHSLLHNKVFRHDDPIWDLIYPPSGFGCKCSVTPIKDDSNVEDGSKYLKELKTTKDFTLHSAKTWKIDTSKYVEDLRNQLDKMLNTKPTFFDKAFENEELLRKISEKFKEPSKEDLGHHHIAEMLGFTAKPKVLNKAEIDELNLSDYYITYRGLNGIKAQEFYDQFKYGDYFSGRGIFGSGTYVAIDDIDATRPFTDQKDVMKILYPKNANIINFKDLERDFNKREDEMMVMAYKKLGYEPYEDKIIWRKLMDDKSLSEKEIDELEYRYEKIKKEVFKEFAEISMNASFLNDIGNYAILKGYDAIFVEDKKYLVIMNRSKCIVQKENVELPPVEFSEKKIVNMPADLSRRLGRVWGRIALYNDVNPNDVVRMTFKIASIQKFEDLPEEVQKWVVVAEENIGEDND